MKEERKFKRQCRSCREYNLKEELFRITKDHKTGEYCINDDNLIQGRSIYLCKKEECVTKFFKNKKNLSALGSEKCENIKEMLYTVLKK